jgi:TonB-linked SusC/RagA family outer membrane protein
MKRITTLLVFLLFAGLQVVLAQKTITGTVIGSTDNQPLVGVTVLLKGSTTGTLTDLEGKYSIAVPNNQAMLQYSFIGYAPQEITVGNQTSINITLSETALQMNEVVVTALGIKRESKSLGYSATSVQTEELLTNKNVNMIQSLEGKVAGLNITTPASGVGGSTQIRLRGQAAFAGASNSPLIVINGLPMDQDARGAMATTDAPSQRDLGDNLTNINPDDIETMTVLKGATAAAIYGSRAANGAIIITTKSGQKNQNIGIEYSTSYTIQNPLSFFDFQKVYGEGVGGVKPASKAIAAANGQLSWGGLLDGSDVPLFDGSIVPYSFQPNRVLDYFNVGKVAINTVAFSGGSAAGSFRASFSNTNGTGIEPTNEYKKKTFNVGVTHDIAKKLKFSTNINYTKEDYINPPQVGQQGAGSMNFLTRLAQSIPLANLRESAIDPVTGTEAVTSGFQGTILNPYYATKAGASYTNTRDHFLGTSTLRYDVTDWLYAQGRFNYDYLINYSETKTPSGIGTSVPTNADGTYKGRYVLTEKWETNVNADFLIGVNKKLHDFSVNASFGGNTYRASDHDFNETASNFTVKDFFAVSNGVTKTPTYGYHKTRVNSLYELAEFGYKSMLYLNFTGRTDWFSVLNPDYNSKFYPSVSGSFVFSELLKGQKWLTYAKLRGSWAEVGSANGVSAYDGILTYALGNYQFNGQTTATIQNTSAPNPVLQPFTVTEKELGLEARMFDNKLHVDVGYFHKVTTDQIMSVQLSDAAGYTTSRQNLGSLKNAGLEFLVEYTPIETKDFSWTTSWNHTYLTTEVLSVGKSPDGTPIQDFLVINYNGTGNEFLGELHYTVGMAMNQLYTKTYLRDADGNILLQNNGKLLATPTAVPVGSSIPKHTGGWNNSFTYKNLTLGLFIDYKFGGKVLSSTYLNMTRQGMSDLSLEGRRVYADGTIEAGLVFPGVYQSTGLPNTTAVTDLQGFYGDYRNLQIGDPFTFKSDFVKLRSISLSYNLTNLINNVGFLGFVKGLSLTSSIRNVAILYKDIPNLDPEAIQSSGDSRSGYENSSLLTTRDIMFGLNVKF